MRVRCTQIRRYADVLQLKTLKRLEAEFGKDVSLNERGLLYASFQILPLQYIEGLDNNLNGRENFKYSGISI